MQGTAADIIKLAMIEVDAWCTRRPPRRGSSCRCTTSWCWRYRRGGRSGRAVRERMVEAATLSVPLKVDVGMGANWDEAH